MCIAEAAGYSVIVVGNIPYEASEEQLKEIFSDVGPVASFRYLPSFRLQT